MYRAVTLGIVAICMSLTMYIAPCFPQDKPVIQDKVDLNTLDCRTLLKMIGDQRNNTLLFYHGFMSGMNQEFITNIPELAEVTDQVIDHCIDNPNDTLMDVFKSKRNKTK